MQCSESGSGESKENVHGTFTINYFKVDCLLRSAYPCIMLIWNYILG